MPGAAGGRGWCWAGTLRRRAATYRLAFARLVTHYWSHGSGLEDVSPGERGPAGANSRVLVQGTLDLGNLIGTPWTLAAAWPGVELRMVDAATRHEAPP